MYKIDREFTKKYLSVLLDFSKFLIQRTSALPASKENRLNTFFCQLKDTCNQNIKLINKQKSLSNEISINPNIVFAYKNPEDHKRKFHISIGGKIKIQDSIIIEQSLCVNVILEHTKFCTSLPEEWQCYPVEQGFHILRRFHFDYDSRNDDYSKPKFHLQYGGKLRKEYFDFKELHYKLFQPIDYPRLPQQPHDIIMLLDFLLREFSLDGKEITEEKRWNELVIKSEQLWLKPYYEELMTRLNCSSRHTPLHRIKL
jgi:hypothetical protein